MQVIPFAFVAVWWVVALIVLLLYFKFGADKKSPFEDKYVYELLPVVYDQCNGLTAKHVYLIRIAYGHRNKRFFFPNATISLRFYDDQNKNVATVQLKPKLLTENHRRYLRQTPRSSTDTFLYVLYKRKTTMSEPKLVLVNHNVHGGAIMIINLFVLRLADNSVFGSKIGKSVQCLKSGLDPDSQSFRLVCFGKCVHYVGPRHNVTLFEMICFIYLQLSLIALCCASVLSCQGCNFCCLLCRHFKGLSHAFEISLYAGYCSVACTALLLLIFQCILKRLNAKWNNVGYIWLAMRALPYLTAILCLTLDVLTVTLLMTSYQTSQLTRQQHDLWLISVLFAWTIYILVMFLLVAVLYLNGYFDQLPMPQLEFESDKVVRPLAKEQAKQQILVPTSNTVSEQKSCNYSTRNLIISSSLQERSSQAAINSRMESISKVIEANYRKDSKKRRSESISPQRRQDKAKGQAK